MHNTLAPTLLLAKMLLAFVEDCLVRYPHDIGVVGSGGVLPP